jgi:hypothetical protein
MIPTEIKLSKIPVEPSNSQIQNNNLSRFKNTLEVNPTIKICKIRRQFLHQPILDAVENNES